MKRHYVHIFQKYPSYTLPNEEVLVLSRALQHNISNTNNKHKLNWSILSKFSRRPENKGAQNKI